MMVSVGQRLRAARLDQGLDFEAVAARTKINEKFLKAIEADDRNSFPGGFFYKSFVDQYARALSLDTHEIDEHINAVLNAEAPLPLPGQDGMPVRRAAPLVVKSSGSKARAYLSLGTFVLVLVGCSGFYAWWHNLTAKDNVPALKNESGPKTAPLGEQPGEVPHSRVKPAEPVAIPAALIGQNSKPTPDEIDASESAAQPAARLLLELIARQETWLSISSDGLMVFKGKLEANESKTIEGKEFAKLRVNDAAAIDVKLNGRAIGPLGARGQFRTVVFTRDKFHVLESSKESD